MTWDRAKAAHLFRRAGFGATPAAIDSAVADGLDATVDRFLTISPKIDEAPHAVGLNGIIDWWIARFLTTNAPLRERMTFFWHDHFATSIATVRHPDLMLQQNRLFRSHALGNMRELATAVARDPAMLLWLDNYLSVKQHPNENFGRELLELFLLGLGNYQEGDVLAAARSFTGWGLTDESEKAAYVFHEEAHDSSAKRFLGRTGSWDGGDIVRIACGERVHARFLARKLFASFAYADPDEALVDRLASIYLHHDCELRPLVRAILISPEMYSSRALWSRVKSPLDHAVMACRQLGLETIHPSVIADAIGLQGLTLFAPPDVSGWKGNWINSWTLLVRFELASTIARSLDPSRLRAIGAAEEPSDLVDFYLGVLGSPPLSRRAHATLMSYAASATSAADPRARDQGVVRLILSMPEWQLN